MEYQAVIGLEVHAQLLTESKIFCGCSTAFGAPPNTHVCQVCLGMPGVLPVLNEKVVEFAVRAALATGCRINPRSVWARKNYFYPDLPKGYQISQYTLPLAEGGKLDIEVDGAIRTIGITRIHMEEDAGKLVHDPSQPVSYVDLNRAGTPLLEIVSEPDMHQPREAMEYLRTLRDILVYLDICDGNMEEGSFRCDANISLRPLRETKLGTRAELKNMNSFRNVSRALGYEIRRQKSILEGGGQIAQETRLWNPEANKSEPMRGKEEAHDYRYFPDPDLLPLFVDQPLIQRVAGELPELPAAKRARLADQYGLSVYDAEVLTTTRALADFFEETVEGGAPAKKAANWVMGELTAGLKVENRAIEDSPISPGQLAGLIGLIQSGDISGKMAKEVFAGMLASGEDAVVVVEKKGLKQVSDEGELAAIIQGLLAANPQEAQALKGGKKKLMGFFVGQVMKATKGQANPRLVNQLIDKLVEL